MFHAKQLVEKAGDSYWQYLTLGSGGDLTSTIHRNEALRVESGVHFHELMHLFDKSDDGSLTTLELSGWIIERV